MRYSMDIGAERFHHSPPAMILIQKESDNWFTLTTEKGKEIGVCFHPWGRVGIYIQSTVTGGLSNGRRFDSLDEAIKSYKAADVKSALAALAAA